ncbi:MAG TPA: hypothetical protein VGK67_33125 [Myxococcales bacterium]|jgi:ABC-type nickel/cobalt efflux system permease component RcnA
MSLFQGSPQDARRYRICRVAARALPAAPLLSDDTWGGSQLQFIAMALFLPAMGALLALRKLHRTIGTVWLVDAAALVLLAGVGAWVLRRRRRQAQRPPKDLEEELDGAEVTALLAAGYLRPADLVWENGGWATLLESMAFSEAAAVQQDRLDVRERLKVGALIVAGLLLAGALIVALSNLGEIFTWLTED